MHKIKLHGLGGQGVVTAGRLLVTASCIYENKYAKMLPAFGHERRGAPIFCDVFIDKEIIMLNTFIDKPTTLLIFDPSLIDKAIVASDEVNDSTTLIINANKQIALKYQLTFKASKIYYLDAFKITNSISGYSIPNCAILGALARAGIIEYESLSQSIKSMFNNQIVDFKIREAKEAYEKTENI